jgi:hypothetical protein
MDRITRADVTAYHLSLKETPTRANRALALLSHMFTMAEKWACARTAESLSARRALPGDEARALPVRG